MRTLFFMLTLGFSSHTLAAEIYKVGVPDQDKIFREVPNIEQILKAAEARMDKLRHDVTKPLGLSEDTSLAAAVFTLKQHAAGEIRIIKVDGRSVLALGASTSKRDKRAATALNEGTEELSIMVRDLQRFPGLLSAMTDQSKKVGLSKKSLSSLGIQASQLTVLQQAIELNQKTAADLSSEAQTIAARALELIDAVNKGMEATAPPPEAASEPSNKEAQAASPKKPAPTSKRSGVQTISEVVDEAWAQFNDAEVEAALRLLSRADLLLPKQTEVVSTDDLTELFMVRSLVNIVQGDATAAAWAATQALVVNPSSRPLEKLGPDYGKLHKALAKAGLIRVVKITVQGKGEAYLSGTKVKAGAVEITQGQHLLQVKTSHGWKSSIIQVRDGSTIKI